MKKCLLILALLAYAAVSCDKPETTSVDEPETEAPAAVDTAADTCKMDIITEPGLPAPVVMVYNTSSDNVDFDASINSIFKHFTITLKDGSLASAICHNASLDDRFYFPSDTGFVSGIYQQSHFDSIKYGSYLIVMWDMMDGGLQWGPNCYNPNKTFLYRDIIFDSTYTDAFILIDSELYKILRHAEPLRFTEF